MKKRLKEINAVIADFTKLLNTNPPERKVQRFLEAHPHLVLGGFRVDQSIVISQLPLGTDHRTDFAYLYSHSGGFFIQLIEIERPALKIFRKDDAFRQDFNHAVEQAFDWISWAERNISYLSDVLEPLTDYGAWPPSTVRARVIAGRRADLSNQRRKERWATRKEKMPKEIELITWDGFLQKIPIGQYVNNPSTEIQCVTYKNRGFFEKEIDRALG